MRVFENLGYEFLQDRTVGFENLREEAARDLPDSAKDTRTHILQYSERIQQRKGGGDGGGDGD